LPDRAACVDLYFIDAEGGRIVATNNETNTIVRRTEVNPPPQSRLSPCD
jgi:hypothetical protein